MPAPHPVHTLRAKLEAERLKLVEQLAADGALSNEAIRKLADLQSALTAVSEEIETHGVRLGWGGEGLD
ncbi:MAG: hypothetical protein WA756_07440 [Pseudolabrys sp.]|jgi:hypothetical protein